MTVSELTRLLKKAGCKQTGRGTNHAEWYSPLSDKHFYVPRHPSQEIKTGTLNSILKAAGLK